MLPITPPFRTSLGTPAHFSIFLSAPFSPGQGLGPSVAFSLPALLYTTARLVFLKIIVIMSPGLKLSRVPIKCHLCPGHFGGGDWPSCYPPRHFFSWHPPFHANHIYISCLQPSLCCPLEFPSIPILLLSLHTKQGSR